MSGLLLGIVLSVVFVDSRIRLPCLLDLFLPLLLLLLLLTLIVGPGRSVGIATHYGLDSPGSNPSRDEIFPPSRPALAPTQPPIKWVPVLSRG